MKYLRNVYFLSFCLLTIFFSLVLWMYEPIVHSSEEKVAVVSPLSSYLDMAQNDQVTQLEFWVPSEQLADSGIAKPDITAKTALSYDLTTNQFLLEKNIKEKLPMASLTKIMTAIVALEHKKSDDRYIVDQKSLVGEDSMGLERGEILTLKELLYGLILHSGNDAAEVLANNSFVGREEFIHEMNNKVKTLGIRNTHFTNPTGLEGNGYQYTTAYDLLVMTRYALINFPLFDDVVATAVYTIPQTETHKQYYLENETNLLTSYSGVKGVKTGYTDEAGLCLVTYLEYGDHKIIAVLLGSDNRRKEMKEILDYSLKTLGVTPPLHD